MAPFQRLVRELSEDCPVRHRDQPLRWQSNALFTLQTATESYMCGFFSDVNLCAHHRKVKTISRKDINVAIEVRGREHVGGKGSSADVGPSTTSNYFVSDGSERTGLEKRVRKTDYAVPHDWVAEMQAKVAVQPVPGGKGGGARRGKGGRSGGRKIDDKRRQRLVLRDAVHGISRASFCRMARRGGVERISGLIYEEMRGVMKVFMETIIHDAVLFAQYTHRKTITQ